MLTLVDITKTYSGSPILQGVSLSGETGEAVCVAGANAAGKTTLLTIASGLRRADSGSVSSAGGIGFVPQENALSDDLSVRDNLLLWYAARKVPKTALFSPEAVETRLGLAPFAGRRISRLSGGLKKRTAIACALVGNPVWLIMDEPFASLDLQSKGEILELIRRLKTQGKGLLFTSHDPSAIAAVADRVLLLREGKIQGEICPQGDDAKRTGEIITLLSQA